MNNFQEFPYNYFSKHGDHVAFKVIKKKMPAVIDTPHGKVILQSYEDYGFLLQYLQYLEDRLEVNNISLFDFPIKDQLENVNEDNNP